MLRGSAITVLAMMLTMTVMPIAVDNGEGVVVDYFKDRSTTKTLTFTSSEAEKSTSLELDGKANITDAVMYVTGQPDQYGHYPSNVQVDFGADNDPEWVFSGDAYGKLGEQYMFTDSQTGKRLYLHGNASSSCGSIRLPLGAQVTSATLTLLGQGTAPEDFENGTSGWTTSGLWHLTDYRSKSTSHSMAFNLESNHQYLGNNNGFLTMANSVDLTKCDSPHLKFMSWQETEYLGQNSNYYDQRFVQVSTNFGSSWVYLPWSGSNMLNQSYQKWHQYDFDLSAYSLSPNFKVRFSFNTLDSLFNDYEGWYIDDVIVGTTLFPLNPSMDVGDDGTKEWSFIGDFDTEMAVPDFSAALNSLLANATPDIVDEYGNQLVDIPVSFRADRGGFLDVSDLSVQYTWGAPITINPGKDKDLKGALNAQLKGALKNVTIPVAVRSDTAGEVKLSDLAIEYNDRPRFRRIPDLGLDEDTANMRLLDLSQFCTDDYDDSENLTYDLVSTTLEEYVAVSVVDGHHLSADATLVKNWNSELAGGKTVRVKVRAMDSEKRRSLPEVFTIYVRPVNDEPYPYEAIPDIVMSEGSCDDAVYLDTVSWFLDPEDDELTYDVIVDPMGTVDGENITAKIDPVTSALEIIAVGDYFTPEGEAVPVWIFADDDPEVNTVADGYLPSGRHNWTFQEINVTVVDVNDEPVWGKPPTIELDEDTVALNVYTLRDYITDVDDDVGGIAFALMRNPDKKIGVSVSEDGWVSVTPEADVYGTTKVTAEADDGRDEAKITFDVIVNPVNDRPTIAVQKPSPGSTVEGNATIIGAARDIETAIVRVEYMVEGTGVWIGSVGTEEWSFILDTLTLPNGPLTLLMRSYDGELHSENATLELDVNNLANIPPVVDISGPRPGQVVEPGMMTIRGTASDTDGAITIVNVRLGENGQWISAIMDSQGWLIWSKGFNNTLWTGRELTVYARAFDGLSSSSVVEVTFIVGTVTEPAEDEKSTSVSGSSAGTSTLTWVIVILVILLIMSLTLIFVFKKHRARQRRLEEEERIEEEERRRAEEELKATALPTAFPGPNIGGLPLAMPVVPQPVQPAQQGSLPYEGMPPNR